MSFTRTVLYSAVPILAECHYSNIRDSGVCIGMTIRLLAFLTEDDSGTDIFD
jgi:transposase